MLPAVLPRLRLRTRGEPSRSVAYTVAAAVLAVGLLVTSVVVHVERDRAHAADEQQIGRAAQQRAGELGGLVGAGAEIALSAAAFESTNDRGEDAFEAYLQGLHLENRRGFDQVTFVEAVHRRDLDAFRQTLAATGRSDMLDVSSPGETLYLIAYGDQAGLDLGGDPKRRDAFDRAAATGRPVVTDPMLLASDGDLPAGEAEVAIGVYAPVYRAGFPLRTEQQRRAALRGWAATAVRVPQLVGSMPWAGDPRLYVQVEANGTLLASTPPVVPASVPKVPSEAGTAEVQVLDRTWTLQVVPLEAFDGARSAAGPLGVAGVVASLAGAGLVLVLLLQRRRLTLAERATRIEYERLDHQFALAFDGAPVGIAIVDRNGQVLQVNEALRELAGYPMADGTGLVATAMPEDLETMADNLRRLVAGEVDHLVQERRLRRPDGSKVWVRVHSAPLLGPDGSVVSVVGHVVDISSEREAAAAVEELRHRAFHDPLTGLATRDVLLDRLANALARARRSDWSVAVLYTDLDRFKSVNDRFGHAAGDELLKAVGVAIAGAVRPGDTVARHGGDEFVVLLDPVAGEEEARAVAERVRSALSRSVVLATGLRLAPGASVGIAVSNGFIDAEALLRDADTALYQAKERGRDRVEVFDEELRSRAVRRLSTELVLRQALDDGAIGLRFEPVLDVVAGGIVGAEARIQLSRPSGELVPISELLPVALETGLVQTLGAGALEAVCRAAAAWSADVVPGRWVGIDVTAPEVTHPSFVERLARLLTVTGVQPELVRLEIPEVVARERGGAARRTIEGVRSLGVQVVLDGLGTDLRSLATLGTMGVDAMKLDLSWLPDVSVDPTAAAALGSVLPIAEAAGVDVVITGADRPAQVEAVRSIGFRYVQGGAVAPVLEEADLVALH